MDDETVTPVKQFDFEDEQDHNGELGLTYDPVVVYNLGDCTEMPVVHKRKALTLKQKADIIEAYDRNPLLSKVELARRCNLSRTTLHSIVAKRDSISESMKKFGSYSSMRKKSRTSPFQEIEGKLLLWMEYAKDLNLAVNGFTLRRQAMAIAKDLGFEKFTASNGWIERFKSRHNDYWRACKSSGTVAKEVEKNPISLEPTVEIKEEPADYTSNPSTSNDGTNEEFILPHENNSWTDSVVEPHFTLSVANLASPETTDGDQLFKKRKTNPANVGTLASSANCPEVRPQSPVYSFGEISSPSTSKEPRKDQFDVFGEYIAAKLRNLDRRSCAFAQRAIGDIIFEAEMGKYQREELEQPQVTRS